MRHSQLPVYSFQIQLTPPDLDPSEGGFDMDIAAMDEDEMEAHMKRFQAGQVKLAKSNPMLGDRLISIGREAMLDGII